MNASSTKTAKIFEITITRTSAGSHNYIIHLKKKKKKRKKSKNPQDFFFFQSVIGRKYDTSENKISKNPKDRKMDFFQSVDINSSSTMHASSSMAAVGPASQISVVRVNKAYCQNTYKYSINN